MAAYSDVRVFVEPLPEPAEEELASKEEDSPAAIDPMDSEPLYRSPEA